MSPPDSEGKCQCQHCDGKQSARECLCDSVGVTSTIEKPEFQLGNKKSPETHNLTSPFSCWCGKSALSRLVVIYHQHHHKTILILRGKQEKQGKQTMICQRICMNGLTHRPDKKKADMITTLKKKKMTINFACVLDLSLDHSVTTFDCKLKPEDMAKFYVIIHFQIYLTSNKCRDNSVTHLIFAIFVLNKYSMASKIFWTRLLDQ